MVGDIPFGDRKIANLFVQCSRALKALQPCVKGNKIKDKLPEARGGACAAFLVLFGVPPPPHGLASAAMPSTCQAPSIWFIPVPPPLPPLTRHGCKVQQRNTWDHTFFWPSFSCIKQPYCTYYLLVTVFTHCTGVCFDCKCLK